VNIIIIGLKATGKTTIGKALSKEIGYDFIDLDKIIVEMDPEYNNCRDIFTKKGKEYFRASETKALKKLSDRRNSVIAIGGGAVVEKDNQDIISKMGTIVYLSDDQEKIFHRIESSGIPPFFDPNNPKVSFKKMLNKREKIYEKMADIKIDCRGKEILQIRDEIKARIK
jgi:shikimate kinase